MSRITALHLAEAAPDGTDQEVLRYRYTDGHLTEVINSSGLPLRFSYDNRGRVMSWTDTNDSRYDYANDDRDRCTARNVYNPNSPHYYPDAAGSSDILWPEEFNGI
nr:hypothetical protein [Streptomyces finlayi]